MVKRFIVQIVLTVGKSVLKAFQNVSKGQAGQGGGSNPYSEWMKKTMQSTNIIQTPMVQEEALKILSIEELSKDSTEKVDQIMKSYVRLFNKNSAAKGGSFYIQSKVFNSKEFLLQDNQDLEKQWYIDNKIDPETLKSTDPDQQDENKDQQDENKDKEEEKKEEVQKDQKEEKKEDDKKEDKKV